MKNENPLQRGLFAQVEEKETFETAEELDAEVKKLREEIADLKKWHYIKDGDYPTLDGEYQVVVELMNHRGVYVTTCDNWDSDLNAFTESCYPENIVAWAEMQLQPEDLENHV